MRPTVLTSEVASIDPGAYRVRMVDVDDVDATLRRRLVELNRASSRPNPYQTPEYVETYLACNEHYARDRVHASWLVVGRDGVDVGAVAVVTRWSNEHTIPYRQMELVAAAELDLPSVLAAPSDEIAVWRAISDTIPHMLHHASALNIHNVPANSVFNEMPVPKWCRVQTSTSMPISSIDLEGDDVGAFYARLNKKMRSNLGRLTRRLAQSGELTFVTSDSPVDLAAMFEIYLDVEDRSWKLGTNASVRRDPRRAEMFRGLHRASDELEHRIDLLALNGVPIAGLMSVSFSTTTVLLEIAFDETMSAHSPSGLVLLLAIDGAMKRGRTRVSLHGHFDYYKHRWNARSVPTRELRILRRMSVPDLSSTTRRVLSSVGRHSPDWIPTGRSGQNDDHPNQQHPRHAPQSLEPFRQILESRTATVLTSEQISQHLPFSLN